MRIVLLTGLLFTGVAQADIVFNYDGFYSRMKRVQQPQFSDITLAFVLQEQKTALPCQPIRLYLHSDIHHVPLSIADNGEISLPYDEALKDSKAKMVVELADNVAPCELSLRIRSRMPLSESLSLSQLQHYRQQFSTLMGEMAGISRYWMPKVTGIRAEFAGSQLPVGFSDPALADVTQCQQQHCIVELEHIRVEDAQWQFKQAPLYLLPHLAGAK
ncbi:DUF2987 domain-containing protein [Chromatiaceae bacterium AAb-1]|nr:DUF2987 domain-containing protein [Chromatiaceae bacterium AAb-1]